MLTCPDWLVCVNQFIPRHCQCVCLPFSKQTFLVHKSGSLGLVSQCWLSPFVRPISFWSRLTALGQYHWLTHSLVNVVLTDIATNVVWTFAANLCPFIIIIINWQLSHFPLLRCLIRHWDTNLAVAFDNTRLTMSKNA